MVNFIHQLFKLLRSQYSAESEVDLYDKNCEGKLRS